MISDSADLAGDDIVLELGTGRGILTRVLCERAGLVISAESDRALYDDAVRSMGKVGNLRLIHGDGFGTGEKFCVFVSNLPYSESRNAIEWLVQQRFSRAIIMVQKEFAEKLIRTGASRAVSILANHAFEIRKLFDVARHNFDPPPKVDSVILELVQKNTVPKGVVRAVNGLFSYRRKTIQNIFLQFGKKTSDVRRLEELTCGEIMGIAKKIQ